MNSAKASHLFSSAHSLAQLVITLLAICALIDLIAIAIGYYQVMLLSRALTEETDLLTNNGTPHIIGTLQLPARLIALVFFMIWFYREHRNLRALGIRRGRYSSPWTVFLFLVPILNLYYSYDILKELWKQSSPDLGFSDAFLKGACIHARSVSLENCLIGLWWSFTIASLVTARTSLTIISHNPSISDRMTGTWMNMISNALGIVASI